ncbi:MAG: hypothetical protein Q9179_007532, partial [Wetmoreana sp. 5 TL-2023]
MSQSYIEAHHADEAVRALEQKVSLLMTKNKEQAGKNESFEKKIHSLEARNKDLEVRLKASYASLFLPNRPTPTILPNRVHKVQALTPSFHHHSEHNALARHLNALLPPNAYQHLHPLHSIHTNQPLKNFPKKESDIRTMSSLDVATLLKDLDADVTKTVNAAERKSRLKE